MKSSSLNVIGKNITGHENDKFLVTIKPQIDTDKLKYKELTHLIIKSFYDVYNQFNPC